jgi:DNA anti-recombination protein RmuC
MKFDVSLVSRVSDEIGNSARRLKQHANSPNELQAEIQKLESNISSLKDLAQNNQAAGANAEAAQLAPDQNQT